GLITSSPVFYVARIILYSICLAALPTYISVESYVKLLSRCIFLAIASRNSVSPSAAVYLVSPALAAAFTASMISSCVLRSGAPADRLITSSPSAFNCLSVLVISIVWLGVIDFTFFDNSKLQSPINYVFLIINQKAAL